MSASLCSYMPLLGLHGDGGDEMIWAAVILMLIRNYIVPPLPFIGLLLLQYH